MRKNQLLGFMRNVAAHPYLYTSGEYQQFLRAGGDYAKLAAALAPPTGRRIIARYNKYFGRPDINDEDSLDAKIKHFEKEFKWQLVALREIKQKTKDLADSYFLFQTNLMAFAEGVKVLEPTLRNEQGEVEPWFEYPARTHDFENPYQRLHSWFVMEKQECAAIFGAIKGRSGVLARRKMAISEKERCERKFKRLCEGKMMLPWQSRNRQKVKYEEKIDTVRGMQLGDEIENLLIIGKIVSRRLAMVELPRFLERRAERYAELIKDFGAYAAMEFEEVRPIQMLKNGLIIGTKIRISPSPNQSYSD